VPGAAEWTAEFLGTALIMLVGLSAITFDFASHSPMQHGVHDLELRRLITGVVFAGTGATVIYSSLGRRSGGHFNPAMTLAFRRLGKIDTPGTLAYGAAQLAGAGVAALTVRLAWGRWATSVHVGATLPGHGGVLVSLVAETGLTFVLATLVLHCIDRPRWMPYTAALAATFLAFLITVEAPVSGSSLNPARSFGPALASGAWSDYWIYAVAPPLGALLAAVVYRRVRGSIRCAKLFHTDEYPCPFFDCQYTPPGERVEPRGAHRRWSRRARVAGPEP